MSYRGVSSVKWSTPETLHIGQGKSFLGSLTFLGSPDYWVNISQANASCSRVFNFTLLTTSQTLNTLPAVFEPVSTLNSGSVEYFW